MHVVNPAQQAWEYYGFNLYAWWEATRQIHTCLKAVKKKKNILQVSTCRIQQEGYKPYIKKNSHLTQLYIPSCIKLHNKAKCNFS